MAALGTKPIKLAACLVLPFCGWFARGGPQANVEPPVPVWVGGQPMPKGGPVYLSGDRHTVIVVLEDDPGGASKVIQVPMWNRLAPILDESLELSEDGLVTYTFRVANGDEAKDTIGTWALVTPPELIVVKGAFASRIPGKAWRGAPSGVTVSVDQAAIDGAEQGRYFRWFPQDGGSEIKPGEMLAAFRVESPRLPGFTTAWFGSGKLAEFDQSWPTAVFRQLLKLEDRRWWECYTAAIGPVFAENESKAVIARNFLLGIQAWTKSGQVRANSTFLSEVVALLTHISEQSSAALITSAAPATDAERTIARALQLSLQIVPAGARQGPP